MLVPTWVVETWNRMNEYYPWLKERSLAAGQDSHPFSETNLPLLLTAEDLETYYYDVESPLPRVMQVSDSLRRYLTSGTSSGRRKQIFYTTGDEAAYLDIKLEVFQHILQDTAEKTAMSDMGTGHAEATALEVFQRLGYSVESISFSLPISQHLERLQAVKPQILYTMPSILERLIQEASNPGNLGIQQVILVGEMASPFWVSRIAEQLNLSDHQITDTYGSIEVGTIAYYSHIHERYILTDGLWAEGVESERLGQDFSPLPEGEQVLVLTSAWREAFPVVRYVTYDVVRDLRPIQVDGELRQSFKCIVKRIGPDLKHGEKISIYDIESNVYKHIASARVTLALAGNTLQVYLEDANLTAEIMHSVQQDIEQCIPEIQQMIISGLLERIEVIAGHGPTEDRDSNRVKGKRLWYT
ncbi:cysteine synthase A/phenylacetate-CoA ligase [Paenibacillus shirakamiensis]|uniref:Cysteine synthase A/phenylacetate-CoA ligase n=1 Tax=Paenibacillus shirakamiensis TaxID=1265935 RepID=A0ABS4JIG1_9BACL|nr:CoF synthetase [Paenibacillus shirakamiensis]MBP2001498.1 cysteine synthase A/phenylacetate-CoA ligase [Paenibacillus shirakamiensis]